MNAKTDEASGQTGFDLPTDVMFEIAWRAGATTQYSWGDTLDLSYLVCQESLVELRGGAPFNGIDFPRAVGTMQPNAWGFYDMAGNQWEWCLDVLSSNVDMATHSTPFNPYEKDGETRRRLRGGPYRNKANGSDAQQFMCSFQNYQFADNANVERGFRVAWIRW